MGEKPLTDDAPTGELLKLLHKTIRKVDGDTSSLNFNTAISAMMVLSTEANKLDALPRELWSALVRMAAPYAPHLGEELWQKLGNTQSVSTAPWPQFDPALCVDDELTIVVQVNGKLRADFRAAKDTAKDELERTARALPKILDYLDGKVVAKTIIVPGKLVNFVVL
jgi:leucyl-tRNA synthetase